MQEMHPTGGANTQNTLDRRLRRRIQPQFQRQAAATGPNRAARMRCRVARFKMKLLREMAAALSLAKKPFFRKVLLTPTFQSTMAAVFVGDEFRPS